MNRSTSGLVTARRHARVMNRSSTSRAYAASSARFLLSKKIAVCDFGGHCS